jgi:hypothetical protein
MAHAGAGVLPVFHGLNLSAQQIAAEWNLHPDDAHNMTTDLCEGIETKKPVTFRQSLRLMK